MKTAGADRTAGDQVAWIRVNGGLIFDVPVGHRLGMERRCEAALSAAGHIECVPVLAMAGSISFLHDPSLR